MGYANVENSSKKGVVRWGIALLIVATAGIGAIVCWFDWYSPTTEQEHDGEDRLTRPETVKPQFIRVSNHEDEKIPEPSASEVKSEEQKQKEWTPYSNMRPPNVPEGEAWKPGRPKVHAIDRVVVNGGSDTIHRNATEQTLLNIFSCEVGEAPRPLGNMNWKDREELIGILVSPNPVTEDDTEKVRVSKEILTDAKKEMAKYMTDGGDPEFFLQYYHDQLLKAWKKRQDAEQMAREILESEGDEELARDFVKKVNEELVAEGIKKIHPNFH